MMMTAVFLARLSVIANIWDPQVNPGSQQFHLAPFGKASSWLLLIVNLISYHMRVLFVILCQRGSS